MNSRKFVLVAIAVVAIGLFALPSSISLFSGQHTWYNLSEGSNDVPCEKCHAEIGDEMQSDDNGAHEDLTCAMCHRTLLTNYTYGSGFGSGSTPGIEAHAAAVVQCMDCHDYNKGKPGYYPHMTDPEYSGYECFGSESPCHKTAPVTFGAGGFGLTGYADDTGEKAAHKKFVLDAENETLMEGANEACIACHTRISVNITWTKKEHLDFTASEDSEGVWTISGFAASGENVTHVNSPNEWTS